MQQDGRLSVRQREGLRRAYASAAGLFGWVAFEVDADEPIEAATRDLMTLAERGTRLLHGQLTAELAEKKSEMSQLKQVAKTIGKLAEKDDFEDPVEVPYSHTAKEGSQRWVTKTETLTLTSALEAQEAVQNIEKNMDGWEKLRAERVSELEARKRELAEMKKTLPTLLQSSRRLLSEVLTVVQ